MRLSLQKLYDWAGYLAAACVLLIFIVMLIGSVMRLLNISFIGADDIVAWLCAASAFLGMAHTFKHGDFVRMTIVLEALPARLRQFAEVLALLVGVLATGYGAYWVVQSVFETWQIKEMSGGLLVIPMWIPQLSFAAGAALLFLAFAGELLFALRGNRPTYVTAVEERHARGDFTEDV